MPEPTCAQLAEEYKTADFARQQEIENQWVEMNCPPPGPADYDVGSGPHTPNPPPPPPGG